MHSPLRSRAREEAASFERQIEASHRKRLGQFFTGPALSRLLAALSVDDRCLRILDPMAGTGDLLDAVVERCGKSGIQLERIEAIELDTQVAAVCERRLLACLPKSSHAHLQLHRGSAFEVAGQMEDPSERYDLVITNPPYVRHQAYSTASKFKAADDITEIRRALLRVIYQAVPPQERPIWAELVRGFSGLSDLSVPSWLLSAMLVKPGGILALVAPATWRTRDYADVLLYALARFFELRYIIADKQPGWFSQALVRTHLIVAQRRDEHSCAVPLLGRTSSQRFARWIEIDQAADSGGSLVGNAFTGADSEKAFARWASLHGETSESRPGIRVSIFDEEHEKNLTVERCHGSGWFKKVEPLLRVKGMIDISPALRHGLVPREIRSIFGVEIGPLVTLTQLGVDVGQGLRTGCNDFFYVDYVGKADHSHSLIQTSQLLGELQLVVPNDCLVPVLRRQSEIKEGTNLFSVRGRVLLLRNYVLPEDYEEVASAIQTYRSLKIDPPKRMSVPLADHVRRASTTMAGKGNSQKRIPELSAVITNKRHSQKGRPSCLPLFWYMLPPFQRRHNPDVFIPRVNRYAPTTLVNTAKPLLIDANFSTAWSTDEHFAPRGLHAILNSSWVRACMEAIGTPMGGGALKLEATHLRRIPVPLLSQNDLVVLSTSDLAAGSSPNDAVDRLLLERILAAGTSDRTVISAVQGLRSFIVEASKSRQRG